MLINSNCNWRMGYEEKFEELVDVAYSYDSNGKVTRVDVTEKGGPVRRMTGIDVKDGKYVLNTPVWIERQGEAA